MQCIGTVTELHRFIHPGKNTTWDERGDEGAFIQSRTSEVSDLPWFSVSGELQTISDGLSTTQSRIAEERSVQSLADVELPHRSPKLDVSAFCLYTFKFLWAVQQKP